MKDLFSIRHRLAIAGTVLAAAAGSAARAADVPWTFVGDDSRSAANVASAFMPMYEFVSWTFEPDSEVSDGIPFRSAPPAFIMVVR